MASWRFPLPYIPHPALVFATVHIITHYAFRTNNASQSHPIFFLSESSCQGYMQRALLLLGPGKRLLLFMLDRVLCCCLIECPSSTPTFLSFTVRVGGGDTWLSIVECLSSTPTSHLLLLGGGGGMAGGEGYYMLLTHWCCPDDEPDMWQPSYLCISPADVTACWVL